NFGGTRRTRSPARNRSPSRRRDQRRQSSTAHCRSGPKRSAQRSNARFAADVVFVTVILPSCLPSPSTAATVCVRLCGSIPNVTMVPVTFHLVVEESRRGGVCAHTARR